MNPIRHALLPALAPLVLLACGGSTDTGGNGAGEDDGGSGGSTSSGGSGSGGETPGSGGGQSTGGIHGDGGATAAGGSVGAGGATACCLAMATCAQGDTQIDGPGSCPPGASCYENSICCSTVWCMKGTGTCTAAPTCDLGDRQIDGACPPAYDCYARSVCGTTIHCLRLLPDGGPAPLPPDSDGGAGCAYDYNKSYFATSPEQCAVIDYMCPANTTGFSDACGCGCQQSANCPEWVDCMPSPTPNPQCSDAFFQQCPYTKKAL